MMDDSIILKEVRPDFDVPAIVQKTGLEAGEVMRLAQEAQAKAHPEGYAQISDLELGANGEVVIGKTELSNELLAEHLAGLHRVFPYIATEGRELAEWGAQYAKPSPLAAAVHLIRQMAVKQCEKELENRLSSLFGIPVLSSLNPGSLSAWPIQEQKRLFEALAPWPGKMGITLLPSGIMQPDYTISGIFFQTEKKFYNCQLCPRDDCPNRKAPREV